MTAPPDSSAKRFRAVLTVALLTIGLIAAAAQLRLLSARWLAAHWREQLETVPEEQIPIATDRLAQLGEAGAVALVRALDSPREAVARSAKGRLREEVQRWQELRGRQASRQAICLAQALAEQVERLGPSAQRDCAELAARLLAWPWEDRVVRARHVMAACEKVIRVAGVPRPAWAVHPPKNEVGSLPEIDQMPLETARSRQAEALGDGGPIQQLSHLSGGGLPAASRIPFSPREADGVAQPSAQLPAAPATAKREPTMPQQSPHQSGPASDCPGTAEKARTAAEQPQARNASSALGEAPGDALPGPLAQADPLELMRQLRAIDDQAVASARRELRRRGFTDVQIELARQLVDPDPQIRRQLARALPQVRGIHATPWLLWLCRDRDPEVRLLAVTVLATSNDPMVVAQVEQIARADSDPRIQQQALRMGPPRGGGPGGRPRARE